MVRLQDAYTQATEVQEQPSRVQEQGVKMASHCLEEAIHTGVKLRVTCQKREFMERFLDHLATYHTPDWH